MKTTPTQRQEIQGRRSTEYGQDICVLTLKERDALLDDLEGFGRQLKDAVAALSWVSERENCWCPGKRGEGQHEPYCLSAKAILDAYDSKGGEDD